VPALADTAEVMPAVLPVQRTATPPVPVPAVVPPPQHRAPVDVVIDKPGEAAASIRRVHPAHRGTGYLPYRYQIAGLVTLGSEVPLPELEFFREPWLGKDLDIEVRVGKVGRAAPRGRAQLLRFEGPAGVRYEEHLGRLGANFSIDLGDRIHVTLSSMLAQSPHVAYTNIIEALLRCEVAARGCMLIHSACVEIDGHGVMLSARTDTGKTGTVLRMLREHGARFLSDDMTVLHPDGTASCFPKPLTISSHTLRAVDPGDLTRREWITLSLKSRLHSKGGRGIGLRIGEMNLPVMTANALTQILVPPPKYRADRLVACEVIESTTVRDLFIIERGTPAMSTLQVDESLDELVANTDDAYGFPPYRYLAPVLVVGGEEYDTLRERERDVLRAALKTMQVRRLASDSFGWADEIPRLLRDERRPASGL
jgi:dolichol-phosphate mannosyltransferase